MANGRLDRWVQVLKRTIYLVFEADSDRGLGWPCSAWATREAAEEYATTRNAMHKPEDQEDRFWYVGIGTEFHDR